VDVKNWDRDSSRTEPKEHGDGGLFDALRCDARKSAAVVARWVMVV
jgi:hypothetical protein